MGTWVLLLRADGRRLLRHDLLAWMVGVPIVMAVTLRLASDWIVSALPQGALPRWCALVDGTVFCILTPLVIGAVSSFILLEEKDTHVHPAIAVTSMGLGGYVWWRAGVAMLMALPTVAGCLAVGALSRPGPLAIGVTALAAAPLAGAFALALGAWAHTTVHGFAVMKLALFVLLLPIVADVLGGLPWIAAGVLPSRWPFATYLALMAENGWVVDLLVSIGTATVLMGAAAHRLARGEK